MKVSILGSGGFIGKALSDKLKKVSTVYSYLRDDVDIVFNFASPSSNILYNHALDYCIEETILSHLNVIRFCRQHKIKYIYPSSATVYNRNNNYSHIKKALEEIHLSYGGEMLGLRIFAGYGKGEEHKGEYSSIVNQFCKSMKVGEMPAIYGDGTQTRDFIYIDDIVSSIIKNIGKTGFVDIGTGVNTSFNRIVEIINKELGTHIKPFYIDKPASYVEETQCGNPIEDFIDIEHGIKILLTE